MGFKNLPKDFFGNHYERAKRNYELVTSREKIKFQQKYPYANVENFFFDADIARNGDVVGTSVKYKKVDITGYIFKKNYKNVLYWQPRIWGPEGTVQKFVTNTNPFPYDNVTKFKIYVTKDNNFPSNFENLNIEWTGKDIRKVSVNENDPYFCSLLSACVISHVGGISRKHLVENENTPKIVTSIARYCVYYHLKRFLEDPSKLGPYLTEDLKGLVKNNLRVRKIWKRKFVRTKENLSLWYSQQESKQGKQNIRNYRYVFGSRVFGGVLGIEYEEIDLVLPKNVETDWMSFVKENSDGLTKTGQKLLQMAIESYVYSVLGSQARTRWPIVGQGAKSLQTQDIFHVLVKDSIVQDDPVKNINNLRTAIENTNVLLNLVICPGITLIPSSMIILKKRVAGYNNYLTLATKDMKFGVNEDVNRAKRGAVKIIREPTTTSQQKEEEENPVLQIGNKNRGSPQKPSVNNIRPVISTNEKNSVNVLPTLGGAVTVGFLNCKIRYIKIFIIL